MDLKEIGSGLDSCDSGKKPVLGSKNTAIDLWFLAIS
jgi:hypothetical protein